MIISSFLSQYMPDTLIAQQTSLENWIPALIGLVGVFLGGLISLAAQFLIHFWARRRAKAERLYDLFSQFVGAATNDISRSKWQASMVFGWRPNPAMSGQPDDPRVEVWNKEWQKYENDRDAVRREFLKLEFQIRLVEKNDAIINALTLLARNQPVYYLPWAEITPEKKKEFEDAIATYEKNLAEFTAVVLDRNYS